MNRLKLITAGFLFLSPLVTAQTRVYVSDPNVDKILWTDPGGKGDLYTNLGNPRGIALNLDEGPSGFIYWADSESQLILKAPLDNGGGPTFDVICNDTNGRPHGIALDKRRGLIYWTDPVENTIEVGSMGGGCLGPVLVNLGNPMGIAIDEKNNILYWVDAEQGTLEYADLNAPHVHRQFLLQGLSQPEGIALDLLNGWIYWSDPHTNGIERIRFDGSHRDLVLSNLGNPRGLAINPFTDWLYWADSERGTVERYNVVNQIREVLCSGLPQPEGVAIETCAVYFEEYGEGLEGSGGYVPKLSGVHGSCQGNESYSLHLSDGLGGADGFFMIGFGDACTPGFGGKILVDLGFPSFLFPVRLGGIPGIPRTGFLDPPSVDMRDFSGLSMYLQTAILDRGAPQGVSLTNGLRMDVFPLSIWQTP